MAYKDLEKKKAWAKKYYAEQYLKNTDNIKKRNLDYYYKNKDKFQVNQERYLLKLSLVNKDISKRHLKSWALKIKRRDTICLYCGSTDKLHAHHILSKGKHPEFALFINNGITLCETCHIQEHYLNGDI